MDLTIRPLTPDLWTALVDLFGAKGACSGCWCMYWRIGNEYTKRPGRENRAALHDLVMAGPPPGLLAFHEDLPVGWCQLTPRAALLWLDKTWRLKRVDDLPVWSLSCFYIRIGYRRKGVTTALIRAALQAARQAGAPALEAYPLDAALTPSTSSTGYLTTFERLGFIEVARHVPPRPIMRHDLENLGIDDLLGNLVNRNFKKKKPDDHRYLTDQFPGKVHFALDRNLRGWLNRPIVPRNRFR